MPIILVLFVQFVVSSIGVFALDKQKESPVQGKSQAVFAVFTFFGLLKDTEGFAGEIRVIYVLLVENIAKFIVLNLIQG
jgi:hypothetical protein